MSKYKIFIAKKIKLVELVTIITYLIINILPLYFLNPNMLFVYLLIFSFISLTIFLGSNYLKSTQNIYFFIIWLLVYLIIYLIQTDFIKTKNNLSMHDIELMIKSIRLPLISIVYSQIFRILFILKYNYEPNMYWKSDNILQEILSKQTKNKEDYLWFLIGRFLVVIIIIFINFICF